MQSFVFSLTPTAAFPVQEIQFDFICANSESAPLFPGVNTLRLSSSASPTPDIIVMTAGTQGGELILPADSRIGAFAIAAANVGASGDITTVVDAGTLPVSATLCATDVAGNCLHTPGPTVTRTVGAGDTPTYSVFVLAADPIPSDPANNRVYVRYLDASGEDRGSASVSVSVAGP